MTQPRYRFGTNEHCERAGTPRLPPGLRKCAPDVPRLSPRMDVPAGVELEGVQALRRAEVEGFAPKVLRDGLSAVDLHPTNGVCRAAALGEPEERDEDDGAE